MLYNIYLPPNLTHGHLADRRPTGQPRETATSEGQYLTYATSEGRPADHGQVVGIIPDYRAICSLLKTSVQPMKKCTVIAMVAHLCCLSRPMNAIPMTTAPDSTDHKAGHQSQQTPIARRVRFLQQLASPTIDHNLTLGDECDWDYGFDYDYGLRDLYNFTNVFEPGECCALCSRFPMCTHWTWYQQACWLKRGARDYNTRALCMPMDVTSTYMSDSFLGCASGVAANHHAKSASRKSVIKTASSVRLFCFVLVRPVSSDISLLHRQMSLLKICDGHAVYSNTSTHLQLPDGVLRPIVPGSMEAPYSAGRNALNTRIFMPVFFDAFTFAVNSAFDWVIKVHANIISLYCPQF